MLVEKRSSKQLAQKLFLSLLTVIIISEVHLHLIKSALCKSYGTGEAECESPHPHPAIPMLGSFFHVQSPAHVKKTFIQYKIVPQVIDQAPKGVLKVHYSVKRGLVAKFGNVLNPRLLDRKPHYLTWPTVKDAFYTLFMFDPDVAPYPNASWLHWYVVNIAYDRVASGFSIAKYIPPIPKRGSGLHRIIFLVYQQPLGDFFFYDEMSYNDTRYNFTLRKILKKYQYERPVAGNFFQVQWTKPFPTKKPKITTTPAEDYDYESGKFLNGTI